MSLEVAQRCKLCEHLAANASPTRFALLLGATAAAAFFRLLRRLFLLKVNIFVHKIEI